MTSLFSKARVLVLGNLHTLLDATIDLNSIGAVKQSVRDLEQARDTISAQAAIATGRVNTLTSTIASKQKEVAAAQDNIDLLLGDDDASNDAGAVTIQLQVDALNGEILSMQEDLQTAQKTKTDLTDALGKINTKHAQMVSQVKKLESDDSSARASEQAAGALEQVGNLSNFDSSQSIDNMADRIRDRKATADARLEQAFGGITSGTDDSVALAKAKKAIEARKAALGKTAAAA